MYSLSGKHDGSPPFDAEGLSPPAGYALSFEELRNSILVVGPGDAEVHPSWDRSWRERLVNNFEVLTRQLWQVGIREVFAAMKAVAVSSSCRSVGVFDMNSPDSE